MEWPVPKVALHLDLCSQEFFLKLQSTSHHHFKVTKRRMWHWIGTALRRKWRQDVVPSCTCDSSESKPAHHFFPRHEWCAAARSVGRSSARNEALSDRHRTHPAQQMDDSHPQLARLIRTISNQLCGAVISLVCPASLASMSRKHMRNEQTHTLQPDRSSIATKDDTLCNTMLYPRWYVNSGKGSH